MRYHLAVGAGIVLDTSVMVAAFRSRLGASRQLLLYALDRRFALLLSVPLLLEYESVLTRPEQLAASALSRSDVERVLDDLASIATPVKLAFRWRPLLPDPDDDMVLETAVNAGARTIVTFNQSDFDPAAREFAISILSPAKAFNLIRRPR